MSSNKNTSIKVNEITKLFSIYDKPVDRLTSILFGREPSAKEQFVALKNVSFSIKKGETVGILGKNGSGKSTLLQIICKTLTPESGDVEVVGRIAALLELGTGFNPDFTGRENVYLNARVLGLSKREIESRFDSILDFAEIGDFIDRPMKTYSTGMFVRLAFAVAINVSPDILIIDEALAVGDARFQAKCFDKIREIKEGGATILFVTHDVGSIRQLCDKAIWLDSGEVRMIGDVLGVTSKYMEFMFQDEETNGAPNQCKSLPDSSNDKACDIDLEETTPIEIEGIDTSKPINHWGDCLGCVQFCHMFGVSGRRKQVFNDDELIEIKLRVKLPQEINYEHFGIGFALRTINGTDLVVYDTYGQGIEFNADNDAFEVLFSLGNPLNEGKYLLVVAVEDRSQTQPKYYEFIEGIEYFSVLRSEKHFGLFVPQVACNIRYLEGAK